VNADRLNFRAGRAVAALDRLGTGRYGVAVASFGAPLAFYELGDDGEASDMADAVGLSVDDGCRSLLSGPLCSPSTDLFVGVEGGPNRLFRNEGGHFEPVAGGPALADPDGDARGVSLVDEGGRFALTVGNWEGESRLLRRIDDGPYRDDAPPAFRATDRVRSVVAADFDNDGRQELFCNAFGTTNRLFERADPVGDPDAEPRWIETSAGAAAEGSGFGTGAVAADLDDDGVVELLVVHGEVAAQPISVYAVPGAADDGWLRVRPTTTHGAPARGATVALTMDDGTVSRRVIDAGGGSLCQTEPVAHFGLGGSEPLRVSVRWPDGRELTLEHPSVNDTVRVSHPAAKATRP
jgi:hypothetical protein